MYYCRMSFLVFRKCCFCVDLRAGSFIIGYLVLILRALELIMTSVRLPAANGLTRHGLSIAEQDVAFHRLVAIISIMVLVFEILLCVALVVGLHKRLDQHLEMFYVGSFAFLVMEILLYAAVLFRYAERFGTEAWLLVALEVCVKLILIYFLTVIRSYYYQMKGELKDDMEKFDSKEAAKTYFARTKPVLISSKP